MNEITLQIFNRQDLSSPILCRISFADLQQFFPIVLLKDGRFIFTDMFATHEKKIIYMCQSSVPRYHTKTDIRRLVAGVPAELTYLLNTGAMQDFLKTVSLSSQITTQMCSAVQVYKYRTLQHNADLIMLPRTHSTQRYIRKTEHAYSQFLNLRRIHSHHWMKIITFCSDKLYRND